MKNPQLPVACMLADEQFRQRRVKIQESVQGAVIETEELESGYSYRFPATANWISQLAELIAVERECCPFLQFALRVEPQNGPIWLELTGPEGTKEFLQSVFAEQVAKAES